MREGGKGGERERESPLNTSQQPDLRFSIRFI